MTSTAMTPWAELGSDRERDAAVAEHVVGLRDVRLGLMAYWFTPSACGYRPEPDVFDADRFHPSSYAEWVCNVGDQKTTRPIWAEVPHYTTDAAADYRVLEFVRREWDRDAQDRFSEQLWQLISNQALEDGTPKGDAGIIGPWRKPMAYRVGFYSAAAYEAKRLTQEGERT